MFADFVVLPEGFLHCVLIFGKYTACRNTMENLEPLKVKEDLNVC